MFGVARTLAAIGLQVTTGQSGPVVPERNNRIPYYYFKTAFDERVCPICREFDGEVLDMRRVKGFTIERGKISYSVRLGDPLHPNCRCPRHSLVKYEERDRGPQAYNRDEVFF